jgi:hypothetical protein
MKANELRIGNYVEHISFGIVTIEGILRESLKTTYKKDEYWDDFKFHKPIPLTEELYRKIEKQLIIKGFSYGFEKGKLTLYLSDEWEFESEFLHQIQNLYFALTNEEITIKQ